MDGLKPRPRLPDFLCIGAMRCGTTTLWELLDRNDRIFVPATKELHFFDDRDGRFATGLEEYAQHFAGAPASSRCGESSPSYLFVPGTAERIHSVLPDVKLIAILRDPVARAWSHYWFNVRRGREHLGFEEALAREAERTSAPDSRAQRWFAYVGRGRYLEQLRRYEAVFARERLLVLLLDDLIGDPAGVVASALAHVGVDSGIAPTSIPPERNRALRPRSMRLHLLGVRAARWGAGRRPAEARLARGAAGLVNRLNLTRSMPRMAPGTRSALAAAFSEANAELAAWLGRPLPWTSPDRPSGAS
ncbi:MAG: sulfotransferase [Thermoleophilia bacterium]|nr:sulfotransferase [Thermoleophilia bacterium]